MTLYNNWGYYIYPFRERWLVFLEEWGLLAICYSRKEAELIVRKHKRSKHDE